MGFLGTDMAGTNLQVNSLQWCGAPFLTLYLLASIYFIQISFTIGWLPGRGCCVNVEVVLMGSLPNVGTNLADMELVKLGLSLSNSIRGFRACI